MELGKNENKMAQLFSSCVMQPRFFFSYFFVTFLSYIRMISPPPFSKFQRNAHTWWGGKQPEKKRRAISVLLFFSPPKCQICIVPSYHLPSFPSLFSQYQRPISRYHMDYFWANMLPSPYSKLDQDDCWQFFILCTHSSFVRSQFLEEL